jgi:hypothetical protein
VDNHDAEFEAWKYDVMTGCADALVLCQHVQRGPLLRTAVGTLATADGAGAVMTRVAYISVPSKKAMMLP